MDTPSLNQIIGLADSCELLASLFAYPTRELAQALVDGSAALDVQACLADAGVNQTTTDAIKAGFDSLASRKTEELFNALKKKYSILFLAPGAEVPVWPYEAAFRFVKDGRAGAPSLFRSPVSLSVEAAMQEAGVMPAEARKEPPDSIWNELSFLSYAYGSAAHALYENDDAEAQLWLTRARGFANEHVNVWLPAFMSDVTHAAPLHSYGTEYAMFAQVGSTLTELIRQDMAKATECEASNA